MIDILELRTADRLSHPSYHTCVCPYAIVAAKSIRDKSLSISALTYTPYRPWRLLLIWYHNNKEETTTKIDTRGLGLGTTPPDVGGKNSCKPLKSRKRALYPTTREGRWYTLLISYIYTYDTLIDHDGTHAASGVGIWFCVTA